MSTESIGRDAKNFTPPPYGGFRSQIRNFLRARQDPDFSKNREHNSPATGLAGILGLIATIAFGIISVQVGWASPAELIVRAPAMLLAFLICPYLWYVYHKYVSMVSPDVLGPNIKRLASATIFMPPLFGLMVGVMNLPAFFLGADLALGFCLAWWVAYMFEARVEDSYRELLSALPSDDLSQKPSVDRLLRTAAEWKIVNATTAVALIIVCALYPYEEFVALVTEESAGDFSFSSVARASLFGSSRVGWLMFLLVIINRLGSGSRSETFANYDAYREEIRKFNAAWRHYTKDREN